MWQSLLDQLLSGNVFFWERKVSSSQQINPKIITRFQDSSSKLLRPLWRLYESVVAAHNVLRFCSLVNGIPLNTKNEEEEEENNFD